MVGTIVCARVRTSGSRGPVAATRPGRRSVEVQAAGSMAPLSRRKESLRRESGSISRPPASRRSEARLGSGPGSGSSGSMVIPKDPTEALFLGKALIDTLSDRLGSALLDIFSEASKAGAELPSILDDLQEEVVARARFEMSSTGGTPSSSSSASPATTGSAPSRGATSAKPATPDLQETIAALRAEIMQARCTIELIQSKSTTNGTSV